MHGRGGWEGKAEEERKEGKGCGREGKREGERGYDVDYYRREDLH